MKRTLMSLLFTATAVCAAEEDLTAPPIVTAKAWAICEAKSGKVIEFYDEEIEKLKEAIAARLGYRLIGHKLELYGVATGDKS